MVSKSKIKGDQEERKVVNRHKEELSLECTRTLEKGARSDGTETWDIDIDTLIESIGSLKGECKLRGNKDAFGLIYRWLGANDFLTIRADRRDRLYVIREDLWFKLFKAALGRSK